MTSDRSDRRCGSRCGWRLLSVPVAAVMVLGATLIAAQAGGLVFSRSESPGAVAASAIKELLSGHTGGEVFRDMMQDRTDAVFEGAVLV
ncbi:MAG: hypothetical protein JJU33_01175 [Phycisphaerales bacterium]|nr:hypothetical protein [Phycisphaerales bacterium]